MSHCFGYQFLIVTSILNVERIYKFIVSNMSHCFAYQLVILTSIINRGKNIQNQCLQYVTLFRISISNCDQYPKRERIYEFIVCYVPQCFAYQLVVLTSIINRGKNIQIHCLQYVTLFRISVGNSDQYHKRGKNIHIHCLQYVTLFRISVGNSDQYHKRGNNIQIQCLQYVKLFHKSVGNSDQYHNRWKEYSNAMPPICHTVSHINC